MEPERRRGSGTQPSAPGDASHSSDLLLLDLLGKTNGNILDVCIYIQESFQNLMEKGVQYLLTVDFFLKISYCMCVRAQPHATQLCFGHW